MLEFNTSAGTLVVEVDDPSVTVLLDGEELRVTGAGPAEIRLKTGPYLLRRTASSQSNRTEVFSLRKDNRIVVRVWGNSSDRSMDQRQRRVPARDELLQLVRRKAGEMVSLRNNLDARVWSEVSSGYTTSEAAKLLIAFFRGDGSITGSSSSPTEAVRLRDELGRLRQTRALAFALLMQVAREDESHRASPLVGTWEVTEVRGAGGMAADALELYDPDPVGRKLVVANDAAALLTGAGYWLFDATFPSNETDALNFSVVVRADTVYRGRYHADQDNATLRLSPMNSPRPTEPDGDPTDGSFVLQLRRIGAN